MEKCERMGIDPFEALLVLAKEEDAGIRLGALKEICQYLYPKRKALEHSGEIKRPFADKTDDELQDMVVKALGV